ncbi:response regulator [Aestuariivirga sp.]|uniref:response regulator n=1 Tax=Aestuariivirga sp. TaxID=2650926 RepID=UPI0039E6B2FB
MKQRILVVDDEPQIIRFLRPALAAAGYDVITASTAAEARHLAATQAPEVILLDLGLPDLDGKDVIRDLRSWSQTPILVLSARDREAEKIEALDLGADDYINKPFGVGELLARIRASLRHGKGEPAPKILQNGALVLDRERHSVTMAGKPVHLTPKEFEVLSLLMRNAGKVLTHRNILNTVWGPAHGEDVQYLRVLIGQLRQKMEADPTEPVFILTEPGIGYRFLD